MEIGVKTTTKKHHAHCAYRCRSRKEDTSQKKGGNADVIHVTLLEPGL